MIGCALRKSQYASQIGSRPTHRIMSRPRADYERKPDTGDDIIGRLFTPNGPSRKSNANVSEGTVETDCGTLCRIEACIHRAKEKVSTITETDLGVGVTHRKSCEAAEIGYRRHVRAFEFARICINADAVTI